MQMVTENMHLLTYKIPIEDLTTLVNCVNKDNWDDYEYHIKEIVNELQRACNNKSIGNPFFEKRFITKIRKIGHYAPTGSCGTGYSESDIIKVYFNNGKNTIIELDTWYRNDDEIWAKFKENKRFMEVVGLEENREELLREIHNHET